jgi:DNA repair exonuclease SbcCD ATPase subunit
MKITRIEATNLGKHIRTAIDVPDEAKVLLIAGSNGAGKSLLLQGIRMAFTGLPERGLKHKSDIPELLRTGEKDGSVKVMTTDGDWSIDLKRVIWKPAEGVTPDLVLGGLNYFDLDDNERKKALFKLTGISLKPSDIMGELTKMGHSEALCKRVIESIRLGFESAAVKADTIASENRGAWQAITGERHGTAKGAIWSAVKPSVPSCHQRALSRTIDTLQDDIKAAAARHSAMSAERVAHEKLNAAGEMPDVEALTEKQAAAEKALSECKVVIAGAQAAIAQASKSGWDAECPNCGTLLHSSGPNSLAIADKHTDNDVGVHTGVVAKMQSEISDIQEELAFIKKKLDHAAAIQSIRATVSNPPTQADVDESGKKLGNMQAELSKAQSYLAEYKRAIAALVACDGLTRRAYEIHEAIAAAVALAESIRALPSKFLGDAISQVNSHLLPIAAAAGATIALNPNLSMTYDGIDHHLCSKSEQWILSMGIACALAKLSNAGMVMMDEFDVLAPARRGKFLKYLADQPFQTIIAATLKERPTLAEPFHVYWIGE